MRIALLVFFQTILVVSFSQTTQQQFLRSQAQKAPDKIYHKAENDEMAHRDNRAVIFYDDFSNPANWTMTNTSSPAYDWEITNFFPNNLVIQNFGPLVNSTSGGNFAIANSDAQGSSGIQNCNMTNVNSIDCSLNPNVRLRFENYHKILFETHTVYVSNDGVNYDPYPVNSTYGASNNNFVTSPNCEEVVVNITATAGMQSTVWIRFNYEGSYDFFWVVDDVIVEDLPKYDVAGITSWTVDQFHDPILGQRIDYTILPISQNRTMKILSEVQNNGLMTAMNEHMDVTIKNYTNTTVFQDSSIQQNLSNQVRLDSVMGWNPPSWGQYSVEIKYDFDSLPSDGNSADNFDTLDFSIVSDYNDYFARDIDDYSSIGLWNGDGNPYVIGQYFYVTSSYFVNSIDVAFTQGTDPGASVCVQLYELDPSAATINDLFIPIVDNCLDGIEHTITMSDISTPQGVIWNHFIIDWSYSLMLQPGKLYMAALNHWGGIENVVIMDGGRAIPDNATTWIYDGGTWFYMSSKPAIRMSFWVGSVTENESDFLKLNLSPNPANETVSISYDLNYSSDVEIIIYDIAGKEIKTVSLGNRMVGEQSVQLDVSDLSEGAYVLKLKTDQSEQSTRLIIAR